MLSREAIVTLRAPRHGGTPAPDGFIVPGQQWLAGSWHITHSTRSGQYSKTGGSLVISSPQGETSAAHTGTTLLLEPDAPTVTTLQDKSTNREWQILASGKEGQLESWMIEDGSGWIADDSGEVRADWRNSYLVFYINTTAPGDRDEKREDVEIVVCERFGPSKPLSVETVGKIRDALRGVCDEKFGALVGQLGPVVVKK